jgi:hypothetical protein
MDGYSTHLPILCNAIQWCLRNIENPRILEIGVGWYSTPVIQMMGGFSFPGDTPEEWKDDLSELNKIYQFSSEDVLEKEWDLVFIDSWPEASRIHYAWLLRNKSKIIILHDSDEEWQSAYNYACLEKNLQPSYVSTNYTKFKPNTLVLSQESLGAPEFL